ncbi:MAG: LON peptidase substrate-binding domain-containing protein, partial [Bacteroidaceae bacterium]|nr:LON peptidase substrate-binding domain-containing protein [Bacteroidaceae bacterium]
MWTKKQSEETFDESNPAFSMIADFDGNESGLFDAQMDEVVPVLPLRNMVLFPTVVMPVTVGRKSSLKLIQNASADGKQIAVFCQKDPDTENPGLNDLYSVGVLAKVIRVFDMPDQTTTVVLQGMQRIKLRSIISDQPYLVGTADLFPEVLPPTRSKEFKAIVDSCKDAAIKYVKLSENIQPDAAFALKNISNGLFLINFICANLPFEVKEKARLLREGTCSSRALTLLSLLNREIQLAELKMSIQRRTHEDIDKQQKEYFLQQELKNIQDELGGSVQDQDIEEMRLKAGQKKWSADVRKIFDKELLKLERTNSQSPDYNVQLSYLQTVLSLPWEEYTKDNLDMNNARKALDKDHYGLEKVKERILEHLAVMKLRGDFKSPILCLYGPPGVGKTSLGLSIANALKRKYVRISLGGLHDEAEIRGHRKTYIGAMPGRIIKGLAKAGSSNPVFILDEIDK